MFGGVGGANGGIVSNGRFANWRLTIPNQHALRRSTDRSIGPFYTASQIERMLASSTTYDQLRTSIESGPNGTFHTSIGGSSGDMTFMKLAPVDVTVASTLDTQASGYDYARFSGF